MRLGCWWWSQVSFYRGGDVRCCGMILSWFRAPRSYTPWSLTSTRILSHCTCLYVLASSCDRWVFYIPRHSALVIVTVSLSSTRVEKALSAALQWLFEELLRKMPLKQVSHSVDLSQDPIARIAKRDLVNERGEADEVWVRTFRLVAYFSSFEKSTSRWIDPPALPRCCVD